MRVNVQSLSILKGGRATAALLSAKENQKTLNCTWRKSDLRQEMGWQGDRAVSTAVLWALQRQRLVPEEAELCG